MKIHIRIQLFLLFFVISPYGFSAVNEVNITLGGTEVSYRYTAKLLTRALATEGYTASITYLGDIPTPRLEYMMTNGDISCFILGKTDARSNRFLTIDTGMTNNLFGHRILLIQKGSQSEYDEAFTLESFRDTGKIAGMGNAWGDVGIWKKNNLPVQTIDGDWRNLYKMVASGNRNIDYLSRGAQEIIRDYKQHPELEVEKNIVLVYRRDHILYVSPKEPELHRILSLAMIKAEATGLIGQVAREFYPEVYEDPINLDNRRVINLELPD